MSEATIYVLWGGLKHYFDFRRGDVFYIDIQKGKLYPPKNLAKYEKIYLVDDNIVDGSNILYAKKLIELSNPNLSIILVGSSLTEFAEKILDINLPKPEIHGKMIVFVGLPCSGKTSLAKALANHNNIPLVKWGKIVRNMDIGKYGEKLAKIEEKNPFVVAEKIAEILNNYKEDVVILDGVKNIHQLKFVSLTLRRSTFIVFVENEIRDVIVKLRQDFDDAYDRERLRLFKEGLESLKRRAHVILDLCRDWDEYAKFLNLLGINVPKTRWGYNIFFSKRFIVKNFYDCLIKFKGIVEPPRDINYHTSYLEKWDFNEEEQLLVKYIATAFRIIDDILDENTVRNFKPTLWVKHGVFKAILYAIILTLNAKHIAKKLGVEDDFMTMLGNVKDSVIKELEFEEARGKPTLEDWLIVAGKEAWFRWFVGKLLNENEWTFYLDGLRAQAKDDIFGLRKWGREETETRLRRPLIQNIVKVDIDALEKLKEKVVFSKKEAEQAFKTCVHMV